MRSSLAGATLETGLLFAPVSPGPADVGGGVDPLEAVVLGVVTVVGGKGSFGPAAAAGAAHDAVAQGVSVGAAVEHGLDPHGP